MRYEVHPLTVWQSAYRARMGATAKVSYRVVDTHTVRHSPRDGVRAWSYDEAVARQICDMLNGVNLHASHWQAEAHKWQGCLDMANRNAAAARADADRLRNQLFEAREQRDEARADARNAWAELKKQPHPETDEALRGRLKIQGVFNRHEWRLQTDQGEALDALAAEYGLRRCPAVTPVFAYFAQGSAQCMNERGDAELVSDILVRVQKAEASERTMRLEAARAQTELAELRKALEAPHRELANARQYWASQGPHDHVVISLAGYNKLVTERDEALAKYAACVDVVSFVDGRWVRTS